MYIFIRILGKKWILFHSLNIVCGIWIRCQRFQLYVLWENSNEGSTSLHYVTISWTVIPWWANTKVFFLRPWPNRIKPNRMLHNVLLCQGFLSTLNQGTQKSLVKYLPVQIDVLSWRKTYDPYDREFFLKSRNRIEWHSRQQILHTSVIIVDENWLLSNTQSSHSSVGKSKVLFLLKNNVR